MNHSTSISLYNKAKKFIPGGVNSPVRSFNGVGGNPVFFKSAKGSKLFDADDNSYIDFVNSWGPMILGHAHESVIEAIKLQAENSTSFGAPSEVEIDLAELITNLVPNVDKIRMVNSGTEACMSAIRLARGYTGKDKIIKFEGCYHGHADSFLIKAGSGAMTLGIPNSPGVTAGTAMDTLNAVYNNLDSVKSLVAKYPNQIACIILEPVAGNMGCVPPSNGFLQGLRDICNENSILLIFDEVMTGFRLALGGAQEYYGVNADLVTYGKIIGGGLPVGAYGGSGELMDMVAPDGPVYQAGTLSGNPLAMISGLATLRELKSNPTIYENLDKLGKSIAQILEKTFVDSGIEIQTNQVGSMLSIFFCSKEVIDFQTASNTDINQFNIFFHSMLNSGIYLPPSAYETWFLSSAHNESDFSDMNEAIKISVQKVADSNSK